MVGTSDPLYQYMMTHPDYFFGASPENALLNPDNIYILLNHMKCSAYELPFHDGESFGNAAGSEEMLAYLADENILRHVGSTYHWSEEDFPASEISLRTAMTENFLIMDVTDPAHTRMVGEMRAPPTRWKSWTLTPARPSSAGLTSIITPTRT